MIAPREPPPGLPSIMASSVPWTCGSGPRDATAVLNRPLRGGRYNVGEGAAGWGQKPGGLEPFSGRAVAGGAS